MLTVLLKTKRGVYEDWMASMYKESVEVGFGKKTIHFLREKEVTAYQEFTLGQSVNQP